MIFHQSTAARRVPDVFCNVGSDPQEEWKLFNITSITCCAIAGSAGDHGCIPDIKQVVLTITDSRQCMFADYPHQFENCCCLVPETSSVSKVQN